MATRYYTEITTVRADRWRIEIEDPDFAGAESEIMSGSPEGFTLSYPTNKMKLPAIMPSEFRYTVAIQDPAEAAVIGLIGTSEEGRFKLKVYRWDGADWAFWWGGVVLPEVTSYEDSAENYRFEISAIDGITYLKKYDYNDGGDPYEGNIRLSELVGRILKLVPHINDLWTGSTDFIRTIIDYYEDSISYSAASCPLYHTQVNQRAFFTLDNAGNPKWMSCWKILENIVNMFNLQLFQHNGFWLLQQTDVRSEVSFYARQYAFAMGAPSAAPDMYGKADIDPADTNPRLTGGRYSWMPSLKRVKISYNAQNRRNYIPNYTWTQSSGDLRNIGEIDNVGGAAAFRFKGGFTGGFQNTTATEGAYYYPVWEITLKVGSYYLQRSLNYVNGQISYGPTTWTTTVAIYQYTTGLFQAPSVGSTHNVSGGIDFVTPLIPASGAGQVDINFAGVSGGGGSFTSYWSFGGGYLELLLDGNSITQSNDVEYEQVQPDGTGTEEFEFDTVFADGTSSASAGALIAGAGNTSDWGLGGGPYDQKLVELLMGELLKAMDKPRRKMSHEVHGPYFPFYYILDDGADEWVWLGGSFTATTNKLSGEWVKLDPGTATYDPIKIVFGNTHVPIGVPGGDPNPGGGGASGLENVSPATLEPVSAGKVDALLTAGAVTTIPLQDPVSARAFVDGQRLSIVNPATGHTDTVEVTTDSADGDTSIAVTGTLTADYGEGSYIVVRLDTYFLQTGLPPFSLPFGTLGQILRHDGDAWAAYSGVTDGHVLTWDTTNGWQAEAAASAYTDEQAQDAVGGILLDSSRIDFTYNDGVPSIQADIITNSIGNTQLRQGIARSVLGVTGNATANFGDIQGTTDQVLRVNSAGTALAFGQVATGGIADDAVTYAKLQNVAANNVLLGNDNGANQNAQELTVAEVYALLGFTGVANRFALWTGTNVLSSDAAFTFDSANDRMTITGTIAGIGANAAWLNLNGGAITGATEALRASANINGNFIMGIYNAHNANTGSNTIYTLSVGGGAAGDPIIQFTISGQQTHSIGVDNSDSDKLKITPTSATPGGVANCGIIVTNSATPSVGINKDSPGRTFDVDGVARAKVFEGFNGTLSQTFGTGAGTGPSSQSLIGSSTVIEWFFTTGTAPTANATISTITVPWTVTSMSPQLQAWNASAATDFTKFYIESVTGTTMVIKANGTLAASTAYRFKINILGTSE